MRPTPTLEMRSLSGHFMLSPFDASWALRSDGPSPDSIRSTTATQASTSIFSPQATCRTKPWNSAMKDRATASALRSREMKIHLLGLARPIR